MTGHAKKGSKGRTFNPENRDERRLGERADTRSRFFGHLASLDTEALAEALAKVPSNLRASIVRLSSCRGPNRLSEEGRPTMRLVWLTSLLAYRSVRYAPRWWTVAEGP